MKSAMVITTLIAAAFSAPALRRQNGANLQTFSGALGGISATPITNSGNANRPFQVKADTFVNIGAAVQRSCDQQFNACANKANGGDKTLSVSTCSTQQTQCNASTQASAVAAQGNGTVTGNPTVNGTAAANNSTIIVNNGTAAANSTINGAACILRH
ncbi:hypothetical protein ACN47E_004502 [Coniothyrium glycines]